MDQKKIKENQMDKKLTQKEIEIDLEKRFKNRKIGFFKKTINKAKDIINPPTTINIGKSTIGGFKPLTIDDLFNAPESYSDKKIED